MAAKKITALNDALFKRSVGSAEHTDITCGLISDLLDLDADRAVIENPYSITLGHDASGVAELRLTEVDIRVRLADKTQIVIEAQRMRKRFFRERVLYYQNSRYVGDLDREELRRMGGHEGKYSALRPTHSISILGYKMFVKDRRVLRTFSLYDERGKEHFCPDEGNPDSRGLMSLTFLETSKQFDQGDTSVISPNVRHWMDFFCGREVSRDAPDYIRKAAWLADLDNLSLKEMEMLNAIERAEADRLAEIAYGVQEGEIRGEKRGEKRKAMEVAKSALAKGSPADFVAEITGLDLATIQRLQTKSSIR
ncbi:MAG: Rpn family recombination-promoting nuclease/putative transposase [Coriobacteriales bacterium]|nr:Rpn family recombination-promoting nuclease/putative transposase [Coriobacteriales bacterium]